MDGAGSLGSQPWGPKDGALQSQPLMSRSSVTNAVTEAHVLT